MLEPPARGVGSVKFRPAKIVTAFCAQSAVLQLVYDDAHVESGWNQAVSGHVGWKIVSLMVIVTVPPLLK